MIKIYTKSGDKGDISLFGNEKIHITLAGISEMTESFDQAIEIKVLLSNTIC